MYGHGHTHLDELIDPYYERCKDPRHKVLVYNFPTLWADRKYSVVAVDNNGISIKSAELYNWPVVLITAPINKNLNGGNPNSHPIPRQEKNPIRALVFSKREIRKVDYIIDNDISTPRSMKQVADSSPYYPYLWEAEWDTRSLSPGPHTIRVRADEIPIESSRDQIRVDIE
jgi:hypothetical protein